MKNLLLIIMLSLVLNLLNAQKIDSKDNGFGLALSSYINSEVNSIIIVPGAYYYRRKSQLELGVGFDSSIQKDQRIITGEFNYKYFPNGRVNKFNMYLIMSFAYINQLRKTYFPASYQYLFLNGGYGFQISTFNRVYIGTNINIGAFTNRKRSENPNKEYNGNENLFDDFGLTLVCQLNVGYSF